MKNFGTIILFDPSYGTSNLGDQIISEAIMRHMHVLFTSNYLVRYSTHTPLLHSYQIPFRKSVKKTLPSDNIKFFGGSNIIKLHLDRPVPDWNVNLITMNLYKGTICIGGGLEGVYGSESIYSKIIHKRVFSKLFIHSVRDEVSKKYLQKIGLKAINTGCPTIWDLTQDHCDNIPTKKSVRVVFTLTDYLADKENDMWLIGQLLENYEEVYFWPQGEGDLNYLDTITEDKAIHVLKPSLHAFKEHLLAAPTDYIGTRLHAGIYSLQHKRRSLILSVDNRARDMKDSFNIPAIERDEKSRISSWIRSSEKLNLQIDVGAINEWKSQFFKHE